MNRAETAHAGSSSETGGIDWWRAAGFTLLGAILGIPFDASGEAAVIGLGAALVTNPRR